MERWVSCTNSPGITVFLQEGLYDILFQDTAAVLKRCVGADAARTFLWTADIPNQHMPDEAWESEPRDAAALLTMLEQFRDAVTKPAAPTPVRWLHDNDQAWYTLVYAGKDSVADRWFRARFVVEDKGDEVIRVEEYGNTRRGGLDWNNPLRSYPLAIASEVTIGNRVFKVASAPLWQHYLEAMQRLFDVCRQAIAMGSMVTLSENLHMQR